MIGKIKRGDITLDYTEVARPITFTNVKDDLDVLWAEHDPEPAKLVFWPHQLDWMIKVCGQPVSECVDRSKASPTTLWGIPVELRDDIPEAKVFIVTPPKCQDWMKYGG